MKLVISSSGQGSDAVVDPRFGRCPYFVFADTETGEMTTEANKGLDAAGGAGIAAAQQIAGKHPGAVLTGHCGPNAFSVLESAGIKVYTDVSGTIAEAIEKFRSGALTSASSSDTAPHSGMGKGKQ